MVSRMDMAEVDKESAPRIGSPRGGSSESRPEPARFAPARPHVGAIRYVRTPIVDIDPRTLERHRVASAGEALDGDAFRLLRTQLLMQMRQRGWQTLAVTSPNKGAGKTTISLNLAIGFAMELDYTALLVDADLRDPDLRHMLELPPGPGLADYLTGNAPLSALLIHPDLGNLVVLPGGSPVRHTSELMRSPVMADMIRELRERYPDRLIVFDVPPILSGADTLAISAYMDATILVVEERKTSREDLRQSCDLLRQSNLLGVVLNKSRELREPDPIHRSEPGFLRRLLAAGR
jgi:capsular exopolysaccharide synthesis family protein